MESRGFSRTDLLPYLGSKERVPEILSYKRGLSLEMIRRLHAGLGIPADLLVRKHKQQTKRNPSASSGLNLRA